MLFLFHSRSLELIKNLQLSLYIFPTSSFYVYIRFCGAGLSLSHRSLSSHFRMWGVGERYVEEKREKSTKRESSLLFRSRLREQYKKNMEYYGGDY